MKHVDQFLSSAYAYHAVMDLTEYFDTHTVGSLVRGDYNLHDEYELFEASDVYDCKKCGALVRDERREKHAQWHELQSALLRRLETMASQSRRA